MKRYIFLLINLIFSWGIFFWKKKNLSVKYMQTKVSGSIKADYDIEIF